MFLPTYVWLMTVRCLYEHYILARYSDVPLCNEMVYQFKRTPGPRYSKHDDMIQSANIKLNTSIATERAVPLRHGAKQVQDEQVEQKSLRGTARERKATFLMK